MNYTLSDYRQILDGAGSKLKDIILEHAVRNSNLSLMEIKQLVDYAYPETC